MPRASVTERTYFIIFLPFCCLWLVDVRRGDPKWTKKRRGWAVWIGGGSTWDSERRRRKKVVGQKKEHFVLDQKASPLFGPLVLSPVPSLSPSTVRKREGRRGTEKSNNHNFPFSTWKKKLH